MMCFMGFFPVPGQPNPPDKPRAMSYLVGQHVEASDRWTFDSCSYIVVQIDRIARCPILF